MSNSQIDPLTYAFEEGMKQSSRRVSIPAPSFVNLRLQSALLAQVCALRTEDTTWPALGY